MNGTCRIFVVWGLRCWKEVVFSVERYIRIANTCSGLPPPTPSLGTQQSKQLSHHMVLDFLFNFLRSSPSSLELRSPKKLFFFDGLLGPETFNELADGLAPDIMTALLLALGCTYKPLLPRCGWGLGGWRLTCAPCGIGCIYGPLLRLE